MDQLPEFNSAVQIISKSKRAAIFFPENPSLDKAAAALALYLSLKKSGRSPNIVCSSPMTVNFSQLVGVDKIVTKIGGGNFIVSLDYLENAIDKVSYNIENKKFNLVIQPKAGFPPLSSENVSFSYSGNLDLGIVVGARSLENLGLIYRQEKKLFGQVEILNIDIDPNNSQFGRINLLVSGVSSYSELMTAFLKSANYPIDQDIANNLFLGIEKATKGFSSPRAGAGAFEAAAFCLRSGAKRQPVPSLKPLEARVKEPRTKEESDLPLKPMPPGVSADRPPKEESQEAPEKPTPDWYGPKIFHGSRQV
jgi:hypothetical protein